MKNSLNVLDNKAKGPAPWYKEGLRFECTGCGKCCTGSPGYTWLSPEEIEEMAKFLNLSTEDFKSLYTRWARGRYALLEMPKTYDCIFLKDNKCSVYPVRPIQCRTYPWWPQNLATKKDWEEAAAVCEGIRFDAPQVPLEKIEHELFLQQSKGFLCQES